MGGCIKAEMEILNSRMRHEVARLRQLSNKFFQCHELDVVNGINARCGDMLGAINILYNCTVDGRKWFVRARIFVCRS